VKSEFTQSGRPTIWKTRDRDIEFGINYPIFDNSGVYTFTGFNDNVNLNSTWGGVNSAGFAIANANANDLQGTSSTNNGVLIRRSLRNYESLTEFEAYLNSTNEVGRNTRGNFAVFDRFGNEAMYEIGSNEWWKYDLNDNENGYIVRTNFAFQGEPEYENPRYIRSNSIISHLVATRSMNVENLINFHFRDFSDEESNAYDIPFLSYTNGYFGYIDNRNSICRNTSTGAIILEGINSEGEIPVMWTLSGFPAVTPVIPYIPFPFFIDYERIPYRAIDLKEQLMPINPYLINTLHFLKTDNTGIWNILRSFETEIINDFNIMYSSENFLYYYPGWLAFTEANAYDIMNDMTSDADIEIVPHPFKIISTYPNPNKNGFFIKAMHNFVSDYTIEIYNIKGQLVHQERHPKTKNISELKITYNDIYTSGIYIVRVTDLENTFITKTIRLK